MPQRIGTPPANLPRLPGSNASSRPATTPAVADATRPGWTPKAKGPRAPIQPPASEGEFPKSADGTPIFKQADAAWGRLKLGKNLTIAAAGCAMSSSAMAMSKVSGQLITPKDLDAWLDKNRGYAGDSLDFSRVGLARGLVVSNVNFNLKTLDKQLGAGKPVVIGVDYKEGSGGGGNGTDHWVCVTGKAVGADGKARYLANDPGTGKEISLTVSQGKLVSDGTGALGKYRSTGEVRFFD